MKTDIGRSIYWTGVTDDSLGHSAVLVHVYRVNILLKHRRSALLACFACSDTHIQIGLINLNRIGQ